MGRQDSAGPRTESGGYHSSYQSLVDVWDVLARHSDAEHPMTVKEIHQKLTAKGDGAPSANTISRILPGQAGALDALFPHSALCREGDVSVTAAYPAAGALHVVLENAEGSPFWDGEVTAVLAPRGESAPSYSTIDKLLQKLQDLNSSLFPFALKCVKASAGKLGRPCYVPYTDWENTVEAFAGQGKNNQPRRYYLQSALTASEWHIFSDLVAVYPYLSERQTQKFLGVLGRLSPGKNRPIGSRYAFKRGGDAQFHHIARLDDAIRERRRIVVRYGEYRLVRDNGWRPRLLEREKNGTLEFEPYALTWSNGYYYLIGKNRGMMNLRVDRILSVGVLKETFEMPPGFDPAVYRDRSPVMYPGEQHFVRMRCKLSLVNTVLDFFGAQAHFSAPEDGWTEVSLSIAPAGVKLFALQYLDGVEVLEPPELREEVCASLRRGAEVYER